MRIKRTADTGILGSGRRRTLPPTTTIGGLVPYIGVQTSDAWQKAATKKPGGEGAGGGFAGHFGPVLLLTSQKLVHQN